MPEIFPVQSSSIDALLRRLEVRLVIPRAPLWELSNVITPVSIVDSGITLRADVEANPYLFATAGPLAAPVANTVLADTGALPAGNYQFRAWMFSQETSGGFIEGIIEHRDAANTANNWQIRINAHLENNPLREWTESLLTDERLRMIIRINGTAGRTTQAIIWRRLIGS